MNEARCERCRHAVGDAAIAFAVATGDQRCALRQFVLAAFTVEHQLIKSGLDHGQGGGQLFQVDEPAAGIVRWRQEGGRRPAGTVGAVAPGDAAQVDGIEQQRADVDVLAAGGVRDLLGDVRFSTAGRAPHNGRLAGFHQQGQGVGKLARAQRVVGGDGVGVGHWELRTNGSRGRNASRRSEPRPLPSLAFLLAGSGQGPAERIKRSPRNRGSRSYGAVAVFGKRRAGWRNWMMGVWLGRAASPAQGLRPTLYSLLKFKLA